MSRRISKKEGLKRFYPLKKRCLLSLLLLICIAPFCISQTSPADVPDDWGGRVH